MALYALFIFQKYTSALLLSIHLSVNAWWLIYKCLSRPHMCKSIIIPVKKSNLMLLTPESYFCIKGCLSQKSLDLRAYTQDFKLNLQPIYYFWGKESWYATPKALKSYCGTGLFAIIIHPITFYCSPFFLDMLTQFYWLAWIIPKVCYRNFDFIWLTVYNYTDRLWRKDGWFYGIYVLPGSSEKVGHFRKASTKTLRGKPHTGCFKNRLYVTDTEKRGKTRRWEKKSVVL